MCDRRRQVPYRNSPDQLVPLSDSRLGCGQGRLDCRLGSLGSGRGRRLPASWSCRHDGCRLAAVVWLAIVLLALVRGSVSCCRRRPCLRLLLLVLVLVLSALLRCLLGLGGCVHRRPLAVLTPRCCCALPLPLALALLQWRTLVSQLHLVRGVGGTPCVQQPL